MKTYRVVTVQKTVYVHNVEAVHVAADGPDGDDQVLKVCRVGSPPVLFPLDNVISYEATS